MRISDWSSDLSSSDLTASQAVALYHREAAGPKAARPQGEPAGFADLEPRPATRLAEIPLCRMMLTLTMKIAPGVGWGADWEVDLAFSSNRDSRLAPIECPATQKSSSSRSEEHTSELQSLMRISYAVFCLKNKNKTNTQT